MLKVSLIAQVKRIEQTNMMRLFHFLLYAGTISTALCAPLALAVPSIRSNPGQPGSEAALSGNWQGNVLPPGISPFEVIRSTVTFMPDSTFHVVTEKPTGSFCGAGSYSVKGSTVSLSFPSMAPAYYHLTRSGDKVDSKLLLLPLNDRSK